MARKLRELEGMKLKGTQYFTDKKWVSPQNFLPEAGYPSLPKSVQIHDVTLRDGEQTCGLVWGEDQRVRIAEALDELGVQRIEVGMPIVSDENMRAIKRLNKMNLRAEIVAFCRAMPKDIDAAIEAGADRIIIEHAVNPYLNEYVYRSSAEAVIEKVVKSIEYVKGQKIPVTFMGWDATRSSLDYVLHVFSEIARQAEPESVVFVDSFGVGTPAAIRYIFQELRKVIPEQSRLEFHVHNEFGLAVGSVLAAIEGGARVIHSSMNGLGERTGNVATEQVAAALELLLNIDSGVNLDKLWEVSKLIQDIAGFTPNYNSPVVGERLFWVESGIVVDALSKLKDAGIMPAMSPYLPELVGREEPEFKLGAFSGNASIKIYLQQKKIEVDKDQRDEILDRIRKESRIRKALLEDSTVMSIINDVIGA